MIVGGFNISEIYFTAVAGSFCAEITALLQASTKLQGNCPEKYKKPFYVIVRVLFALIVAGFIPVVLGANTIAAAFFMGVSAPIIMDKLVSGAVDQS